MNTLLIIPISIIVIFLITLFCIKLANANLYNEGVTPTKKKNEDIQNKYTQEELDILAEWDESKRGSLPGWGMNIEKKCRRGNREFKVGDNVVAYCEDKREWFEGTMISPFDWAGGMGGLVQGVVCNVKTPDGYIFASEEGHVRIHQFVKK